MVLCLVTLADLQTRRAGLSAIAEFLVRNVIDKVYRVRVAGTKWNNGDEYRYPHFVAFGTEVPSLNNFGRCFGTGIRNELGSVFMRGYPQRNLLRIKSNLSMESLIYVESQLL